MQIPLLSGSESPFQKDYQCQGDNDDMQQPVILVFKKRDGGIFHFWQTETISNHVDTVWPYWNLMDFTAGGKAGPEHAAAAVQERVFGEELFELSRALRSSLHQPTRFDFSEGAVREFVESGGIDATSDSDADEDSVQQKESNENTKPGVAQITAPEKSKEKGNRVFITHGKNKKILEQVKEIVGYGKFEPVVAQEHETAAKPVPEKVMDDMRSCQAAVIHVSSEGILKDKDGKEHAQINGNVLIEIGAAMALYGKQFILLVEDGVKLPSNLQGLYECRYQGNELSGEATMKLLKSFNEFR